MRLTPLGKLVILILIVGAAVGGWRWWGGRQAPGSLAPNTGGPVASGGKPAGKSILDRLKDLIPNGGGQGNSPSSGTTTGGTNEVGGGDILLVTTPAKSGWLQEMADRFNASHGGESKVVMYTNAEGKTGMASRDALQFILNGKLKPTLWSPGNPMITTRLGEAWTQKHGGDPIIDMTDPNGYRTFLRSPMVFLTTREKAAFLRPRLGGPNPWSALREISTGRVRPPWGRLKFSHADPKSSSSGLATLGLILQEYAQKSGRSDLDALSISPGFITFLSQVEQGLVYDKPARDGTTALTKAFIADPSRYDFITAYEGTVLEAVSQNPDLYVIYPNPTAVSEHAVSLLKAPWISDKQREGALEFIKFLGSSDAIRAGVEDKFRPVGSSGGLTLNPVLSQYSKNGFQSSYSMVDLPTYMALNNISAIWLQRIAARH